MRQLLRGTVWARKLKGNALDSSQSSMSYPEASCRVRYRIEVCFPGDDGNTIMADGSSDKVSARTQNGGQSGSVRLSIRW